MGEDCPHCVFEKTEVNCPGCFEGSHYKPKPITNYDRLRAKSVEEMAEAFANACPEDKTVNRCCQYFAKGSRGCHDCWLDWLKQEVSTNG